MKNFNNIDNLEELKEFISNKSEEEFIGEIESLANERDIQCPNNFGFNDYCFDGSGDCKECWKNTYNEI